MNVKEMDARRLLGLYSQKTEKVAMNIASDRDFEILQEAEDEIIRRMSKE